MEQAAAVSIPDIGTLTKLAVTDGLGIVLAIANLIVLVLIVRWVLRSGHQRETALGHIINQTIVENTRNGIELAKQVERLDNHQTSFMEFLKALDASVRERWERLQKTADFQRADIQEVNKNVVALKEQVACRVKNNGQ